MNIESNWLSVVLTIIGIIIGIAGSLIGIISTLKFFNKDLKSDLNRLNDKIDKHDDKLNNINTNCELLKQNMSYHQERLDKIEKTDQELKDTIIGTFKKMNKFIDNNNKKT